jgi:hypothetical protein
MRLKNTKWNMTPEDIAASTNKETLVNPKIPKIQNQEDSVRIPVVSKYTLAFCVFFYMCMLGKVEILKSALSFKVRQNTLQRERKKN